MKHSQFFWIADSIDEFDKLIKFFTCIEHFETTFELELAAGEIDGEPQFYSDVEDTSKEDTFLEKFDGKVDHRFFKRYGTVVDTRMTPTRFSFVYNDEARHNGEPEFTKIGVVVQKAKKK